MKKLLRRFVRDERGLELSEYAVMAALVIVVAVGAVMALGVEIDAIFDKLLAALQGRAE